MKLTLRIFSLIAVLSLLVFSVACVSGERITVGDIVSAPAKYEGKSVTVSGEYRGWEAEHGSPPVTRSDWVLKDATGAIYVTGRAPAGFNPAGDVGKKVTVTGVVKVKKSQAYIEADSVK